MGFFQAIVLGIVQGLTEFLPVSSDGHLWLTYTFFGQKPVLAFEVFLHLATLIAMVVYFRADIMELLRSLRPEGKGTAERRLVWLIVFATAVSGVLAFALKKVVEQANEAPIAVGTGFLVTAAVLTAAEFLAKRAAGREAAGLSRNATAGIAVAQALAALPGVSRSGLTISAGMFAGLTRESAARFSFLLGIPIIAVANIYEAKDMLSGASPMPPAAVMLAGFIAAGVAGYLAIWGLLRFVRTRPLYPFAVYTALVGMLTIAWGAGLFS